MPTKEQFLQRAKDYAISQNGSCLATEYISTKTKTQWKCKNPEHPIFDADFQIIKRGSWCPRCAIEKNAKKATLSDGLQKANAHAAKNEGWCLSTEYKNARTKLQWKCKRNHTWESNLDHAVRRNRWCQQCFYEDSYEQGFAEKAREYAKSKEHNGSAILPKDGRVNTGTKLTWQCFNPKHPNHTSWQATYRNVVEKGGWCPYCAGRFTKNEYLQMAKDYAISKGGKCLSSHYENQNTKLEFKCHNPDHKSWHSCYDQLVPHNRWCEECKYENEKPLRDKYLEKAKEHAISKGGRCLSTEYINSDSKLLWQCAEPSHQPWKAKYCNVVGVLGRWCPRCSGQFSESEWINIATKHAKSKKGKFLSTRFTNTNAHYEWKCADDNHPSWKSSITSVISGGTWCPKCGDASYYKENNSRIILQHFLGMELNKARPSWNINPQTNFPLELDGYNEKHNFAFEFQGRHHFQDDVYFNSNLTDTQFKDRIKKQNCIENGVKLFILNDNKKIRTVEKLISYIKEELEKELIPIKPIDINLLLEKIAEQNRSSPQQKYLEKAQQYALSRNGHCLSSAYINYNTYLTWKCEDLTHPQWQAGIYIVDNKTWCRLCGIKNRKRRK